MTPSPAKFEIIGLGEMAATKTPQTGVKTLALGSCVAVVVLDPKIRAVGMVHVVLPESHINPDRAKKLPGYFADTGIPALLDQMAQLGAANPKGFKFKLVGGAEVLKNESTFNIGKRNVLAVKKYLWEKGLAVFAEDVGGNRSRNVQVDTITGKVIISHGREKWVLR